MNETRAKELGVLMRLSYPKANAEQLRNWTAWIAGRENGDAIERAIREGAVESGGFIPNDLRSRVMTLEARAAGITPQKAAEINAQKATVEAIEKREREKRIRDANSKTLSRAQEILAGVDEENRRVLREMAIAAYAASNPAKSFLERMQRATWESSPALAGMMIEQMNPKDLGGEYRRQSAGEFLGVQS